MATIAINERTAETKTSKRCALNFWIDMVTAMQFAALLGSGILMKWVLPPGTCEDASLKLWLGHARHWWGDIHFWIAISLIAMIFLHIYLHWNWVLGSWRKLIGTMRSPQSWAIGVAAAGLIAVPLIIPEQVIEVPASVDAASATASDEAVAPCGVAGLSCETCPAAGDRLFGKGCASETGEAADATKAGGETAADETQTPCDTCPSAGGCSGEGTCPDGGGCPDADTESGAASTT